MMLYVNYNSKIKKYFKKYTFISYATYKVILEASPEDLVC